MKAFPYLTHTQILRPQNATMVVMNASLLGAIGCLLFLAVVAVQGQSWLAIHFVALLALAIGLLVSVNW